MKLISEFSDNQLEVEVLTESSTGKKSYAIEGIFAQAEAKNRNGRFYPKGIMEAAVDKYSKDQVATGRAVGELNHPDGPTINLDKVSHRITELKWQGNNVVGKATILSTPMGEVVKGLLDGGVRLGVSTRGMGSLEQRESVMYVKDDFILNTIDIVQDPSAHDAFVNGIMEGVEYFWNNGKLEAQVIEEAIERDRYFSRKKHAPKGSDIREFKNFLSLLKQQF
jgi:Prohead core protein serine protease